MTSARTVRTDVEEELHLKGLVIEFCKWTQIHFHFNLKPQCESSPLGILNLGLASGTHKPRFLHVKSENKHLE